MLIGPASGNYPGALTSTAYDLQLVDLPGPPGGHARRPASCPRSPPAASDGWWYDASNQTVDVNVPETSVDQAVQVTEVGGSPVTRSEPAAVDLTLNPSAPLSLSPGQSATLTTTATDDGPGAISNVNVTLSAPAGLAGGPRRPAWAR